MAHPDFPVIFPYLILSKFYRMGMGKFLTNRANRDFVDWISHL